MRSLRLSFEINECLIAKYMSLESFNVETSRLRLSFGINEWSIANYLSLESFDVETSRLT